MGLPRGLRDRAPERLRRSRGLRQLALRTGLVPPRTTHSAAESGLLHRMAAGRRRAVLIGVHEGSSSLALVAALPQGADLHLVDPFEAGGDSERADARAVKALVGRASKRRGGPLLHWHVGSSESVAGGWSAPLDLVFIDDGDYSRAACRRAWELWSPHLRSGGLVAFHGARGGAPGPTAVVTELFGAGDPPGWRVVAERDTIVAAERLAGGPGRQPG